MSLIKVFAFVKKEQLPWASLYDGGVTKQSNGATSSEATRKRVTELCSCILSDFGAIWDRKYLGIYFSFSNRSSSLTREFCNVA